MRFMMMVKHSENQGPPPKGFMDVMAKLGEEAVKAGTMVVSGGLASTATRRVHASGFQTGKCARSTGPSPRPRKSWVGLRFLSTSRKKKRSKGPLLSWNFTRNTGRVGRARLKFARFKARKTSLPKDRSSRASGWPRRDSRGAPGLARLD